MEVLTIQTVNYNRKTFVSVENTDNGEITRETVFNYRQQDRMVWADYSGGGILLGHLVGTVDDSGKLDMRYHHLNENGRTRLAENRSPARGPVYAFNGFS